MEKIKSVCFIGHRKIAITDKLITDLTTVVERLIADGVDVFNFGSHSQFDSLCYEIVSRQREQCPQIQRVHYCVAYENYTNAGLNDLYEQEIDCTAALTANKHTYFVRNQVMIDHSEICVFYYDPNYLPPPRKNSKRDLTTYQPRSGTALAFQYAKSKNKNIINLGWSAVFPIYKR